LPVAGKERAETAREDGRGYSTVKLRDVFLCHSRVSNTFSGLISRFQDFKISRFQDFKISRFQDWRVTSIGDIPMAVIRIPASTTKKTVTARSIHSKAYSAVGGVDVAGGGVSGPYTW